MLDFQGGDAVGGAEDETVDMGEGAAVGGDSFGERAIDGAEAGEVEGGGFAEHEGGAAVGKSTAEVAEPVMFFGGVAGVNDIGT
jgi:hypothetical protein